MSDIPPVVGRLVGDNSDYIRKLREAVTSSEGSFAKMSGAAKVSLAAIPVAAIAAGAALYKIGESFDKANDTIRVGTGASGDALKGLEKDFKAVVSSVPTDFASASNAIADLNTRTGQTGKGLQDLAKQELELSRLTKTDLSANVAATTRVFGDWGIAAENQAGTLDKLFRASQATGIGVTQLSEKVVQFGAPLRQMGFSFDQSIAILGKFEKEGVNSELVMGSLRIALGKLAREGKEPVAAFREQVDAIKNAGDAGKANALALELFGARAGPDMAAAIREGRFDLGALFDQIAGGKETILGAAADTADFSEKWQVFKNKVLVGLEPLATRVFTAVGNGLDGIMRVAPQFAEAVDAIVGWVREHWPEIKRIITEVQSVVKGVVDVLTTIWDNFGDQLIDVAKAAWRYVRDTIEGALKVIQGIVKVITGIIHGDWGQVWEGIKQIVSGAWEVVQARIDLALNIIKNAISVAMEIVSAVWSEAWNGVKGVVAGALGWILDIFLGFVERFLGLADRAFGWIPGIGSKLDQAKEWIANFRDEVNEYIAGIRGEFVVTADTRQAWIELERLASYARNVNSIALQTEGVSTSGNQRFARGMDMGPVRGRIGEAVPIIAHAGEWVLTPEQLDRLRGSGVAGGSAVAALGGGSGGGIMYVTLQVIAPAGDIPDSTIRKIRSQLFELGNDMPGGQILPAA